ncbi:hypothetical protein HDU98_007277, partial [Podochytrium sp. JEL0797]
IAVLAFIAFAVFGTIVLATSVATSFAFLSDVLLAVLVIAMFSGALFSLVGCGLLADGDGGRCGTDGIVVSVVDLEEVLTELGLGKQMAEELKSIVSPLRLGLKRALEMVAEADATKDAALADLTREQEEAQSSKLAADLEVRGLKERVDACEKEIEERKMGFAQCRANSEAQVAALQSELDAIHSKGLATTRTHEDEANSLRADVSRLRSLLYAPSLDHASVIQRAQMLRDKWSTTAARNSKRITELEMQLQKALSQVLDVSSKLEIHRFDAATALSVKDNIKAREGVIKKLETEKASFISGFEAERRRAQSEYDVALASLRMELMDAYHRELQAQRERGLDISRSAHEKIKVLEGMVGNLEMRNIDLVSDFETERGRAQDELNASLASLHMELTDAFGLELQTERERASDAMKSTVLAHERDMEAVRERVLKESQEKISQLTCEFNAERAALKSDLENARRLAQDEMDAALQTERARGLAALNSSRSAHERDTKATRELGLTEWNAKISQLSADFNAERAVLEKDLETARHELERSSVHACCEVSVQAVANKETEATMAFRELERLAGTSGMGPLDLVNTVWNGGFTREERLKAAAIESALKDSEI